MKPNTFLETIRCDHGVAQYLFYHQKRLDTTLRNLNITANYNLAKLVTPPDDALYRCRFLYDHSQCHIEYLPHTPKNVTTLRLIKDDTIDYSYKYENRSVLNTLFDKRNGCNDVLIVKNGYITDTTIANIAFFIDNQWLTPEVPLLQGTTRSRLMDEGKITPASLNVSDALKAPKIALMNAMMGWFEIDNGIIS